MLDSETGQLWEQYLEAEQVRVRHTMMPILERFIDSLLQQESEEWHAWAVQLASQVADEDEDIPVRLPLFRRVLLPALAEGVREGRPGCARWLAHFEYLLGHSREQVKAAGLPQHLTRADGLLREALRVDPGDTISRGRLIKRLAGYLEYLIHELPDYVLSPHGHYSAASAECDDHLSLLTQFKSHVELVGEMDTYRELIADCEFHFRSYRDYLVSHRLGETYEAYLQSWLPDR